MMKKTKKTKKDKVLKPRPDAREIDFTSGYWGHNLNIMRWDKEARKGRAACWVTPGLREGDIVIVKSENGSMKLLATDVQWQSNVDDMYIFTITPLEVAPEKEEQWVTKVKRGGGGTSILDVASTKEKAQALADEFNAQFQTDAYFIEKYDEKAHAYSRHG